MKRSSFVFAVFLVPLPACADVVLAKVDVEQLANGDRVTIRPCAEAAQAGQYAYRLKSRKTGLSGSSNNGQSGRVNLKPGVSQCFGSVTLNLGPDDKLDVELEILDGQVVVAQDRFTL